ncbi:hypothetical protein MM239_14820 [Belliella sp. DSM 111904]|uniref:Uncharacterized protein n=1 Tax=Belliella filtrata TaxID=2923435 RepID=A0ABS9V3X4_9BACT|nr:hypothetical protein [Belliella filtrata]MCH7410678.1 hypothetical protein [Belliella filtrata]
MNWRKIDENWKEFEKEFNLDVKRLNKNYFHGYQDFYKATEYFEGFKVFYENSINKSNNFGSLLGNSMRILVPIKTSPQLRISIKKKSTIRRLLGDGNGDEINSDDFQVDKELPIVEIKKIFERFPKTEITIKEYGKYGNEKIKKDQEVLKIEINNQPESFEELKAIRDFTLLILSSLITIGRLKART